MRRKYATIGDYSTYIGTRAPDDFDQALLLRASRRIDRALIGAVYDVDDDGMPTDPPVVEALRDATCAQAQWWDDLGDSGSGASGGLTEVAIGNLRLKRSGSGGGGSGGSRDQLAPAVLDHLLTCMKSDGFPLMPVAPVVFG